MKILLHAWEQGFLALHDALTCGNLYPQITEHKSLLTITGISLIDVLNNLAITGLDHNNII